MKERGKGRFEKENQEETREMMKMIGKRSRAQEDGSTRFNR